MGTFLSIFAQSSSGDGAAAVAGVGFGIFFLFLWLAVIGLGIAGFVLWLISLIHVIQHNDVKDRTMWLLIILLVGTIGGVIYFFTVKKQYDRGEARELPTASQ